MRNKKKKKIFSLIMAFMLLFNFISPNLAMASEEEDNTNIYFTDEQIKELSKQLEFYFGEVGEINENGEYIITNPDLLEDVSNNDQYAKELYDSYLSSKQIHLYSKKEFANCVVEDQLAWLFDALDGKILQALGEAMATHAWNTAGKILSTALSYAGKAAGASVSIAFTAGSLAVSAYQCRNFW